MSVWEFSLLVLSSSALMMVGPLAIALDAARRTKSLPEIAKRFSLGKTVKDRFQIESHHEWTYMFAV